MQPGGRIDAGDPDGAEYALVLLAVAVGVLAGLDDGLLGRAENLAAGVVVTLRLGEDLLVTASGNDATLYTCHVRLPRFRNWAAARWRGPRRSCGSGSIRPNAACAWSCEACGRGCGGGRRDTICIPSPSCGGASPPPGSSSVWA